MITTDTAKTMEWAFLEYAKKDLQETIEIQEKGLRDTRGEWHCPKLGQYWDELWAVLGEMQARVRAKAFGPRGAT